FASSPGSSSSGPRLWAEERLNGRRLGILDDSVGTPLLSGLRARVLLERRDGMLLTLLDAVSDSWDRFEGVGNGIWHGFLAWSSEIPLDEDDGQGPPAGGHYADSIALDLGIALIPVDPDMARENSFVAAESATAECIASLESASVMFFTEHSCARSRWLKLLSRLHWV
ncbi:unnamed protein product, partial [Polarella glacialis]